MQAPNPEKIKLTKDAFNDAVLKMFEGAVKNKDRASAESLVFTVIDGVWASLVRKQSDEARAQIAEQIGIQLDRMFRTIIEFDDYDMFKAVLHDLTLSFTQSISTLASDLEEWIWKALNGFNLDLSKPETQTAVESLRFLITVSGREFERILEFLDLIMKLKPEGEQNLDAMMTELRRDVLAYYANCLLVRVFFVVSVNLLFKYGLKKVNSASVVSYLSELWYHTSPSDAGAVIANVTPVPTDPWWLTLLYLYGGSNDMFWGERFYVEDFHGTTKYMIQCYLLNLCKIRSPIPPPSDSQIGKLAELQLWDQLSEFYEITDAFLQEMKLPAFNLELKELPNLQLSDFIERNRTPKIGLTWYQELTAQVDQARNEYLRVRNLIEGLLPLDPGKKDNCLLAISDAYSAASLVGEAAALTPLSNSSDSGSLRSFSRTYSSVPKHCFLKSANVDCSMVWGEIGMDAALRENMHVYEVARDRTPSPIIVERYEPDVILSVVTNQVSEMVRQGGSPNLAFVPLDLQMDWLRAGRVTYGPRSTLSLSGATLTLIHSWNAWPFRDIVIIDRNQCQWIYREFNRERLESSIMVNSANPNAVTINVHTEGIFIPQPNAVRAIKLPPTD